MSLNLRSFPSVTLVFFQFISSHAIADGSRVDFDLQCQEFWASSWQSFKHGNYSAAGDVAISIAIDGLVPPGMADISSNRLVMFQNYTALALRGRATSELLFVYREVAQETWSEQEFNDADKLGCFAGGYQKATCLGMSTRFDGYLEEERIISAVEEAIAQGRTASCDLGFKGIED